MRALSVQPPAPANEKFCASQLAIGAQPVAFAPANISCHLFGLRVPYFVYTWKQTHQLGGLGCHDVRVLDQCLERVCEHKREKRG